MTYSHDQLITALISIMLLQVIREQEFSNLTLDNAEAFQSKKDPLGIQHHLAWSDLVMITYVPHQFWDWKPNTVFEHELI